MSHSKIPTVSLSVSGARALGRKEVSVDDMVDLDMMDLWDMDLWGMDLWGMDLWAGDRRHACRQKGFEESLSKFGTERYRLPSSCRTPDV
jgi:hypothetical protein